MADNVSVDEGADKAIATDDVAGAHFQKIKVDLGGDGATSPLVRGQQTKADSIPVVLPSDQTQPVSGTVTADTELPAAAALADATANPTAPGVGAFPHVYNGTTWDRVRGDTTNGLDVDVTRLPALPAGSNNIGDVDVLTVPADPFGANADAAVAAGATGSIQAKLRRLTTDIDAIKTSVAGATPAGTNNIGDVDVLSVIPGTGATNLGKAEDAAHASGDVGVMALGVRQDTPSVLASIGDYTPFLTDIKGDLKTADTEVKDYLVLLLADTNKTGVIKDNSGVNCTVKVANVDADTTNGNKTLVAAVVGKKIRVISLVFAGTTGTGVVVKLTDGAGGSVIFPSVNVQGGQAPLQLSSPPGGFICETTAATALVIATVATTARSVWVSYVEV